MIVELTVAQIGILLQLVEWRSQELCSANRNAVMRSMDRLHADLTAALEYRSYRVGLPVVSMVNGYQVVYNIFVYDPDDNTHVLKHTSSTIDRALVHAMDHLDDDEYLGAINPHGSISILEDHVDSPVSNCRHICWIHVLAGHTMVEIPGDRFSEFPEWTTWPDDHDGLMPPANNGGYGDGEEAMLAEMAENEEPRWDID